jgi:hypothetical protein
MGKCLGALGVGVLLERAQNALVAKGYVTSRILAQAQNLSTGQLLLTIVPGRIRAVRLEPENEGARTSLASALPAKAGDILNLRDIEQALENFKRVPGADADVLLYRSHARTLFASVRERVDGAWSTPVATNITDDVANFNAGNFPAGAGLDGRAFLVSNALITLIRDPLFLSTAPDGYAFTTTAAIGSCEDPVFAGPGQPWGCQYREPGGAKEGGLQYPQSAVVTDARAAGFYTVVSLNKEDIYVARTPLEALPGYDAARA